MTCDKMKPLLTLISNLATERGCVRVNDVITFFISVVAGVIANCISKWFDGK